MDEASWILAGLALLGGAVITAWVVYNLMSFPSHSSLPLKTYQNVEEWEIKRDGSGRLQGITVHRDAREAEESG